MESGPEFYLLWPRDVFAAEARTVAGSKGVDAAGGWLLEEAFDGPEPKQEFDKRGVFLAPGPGQSDYLRQLADDVALFRTRRSVTGTRDKGRTNLSRH